MNRPLSAVAGGVAGTAVLAFFLLLLEVETREEVAMFEVIARFAGLPDQLALGFVVFLLAGVFAWPLAFVGLEPYIPVGADPAARGLLVGFVLWVAFFLTGRGDIGYPVVIVFAVFTLVAHLVYGFVMGAVYARLTHDEALAEPPLTTPE